MKLITSITLLAFLASQVSAYCPNLCSGHGACGANDKCTCYKYIGTGRGDHVADSYMVGLRSAWTGADCSLRTCPIAYSWSGAAPNGLSVSTALVASITTPAYTFDIGSTDLVTDNQSLSVGSKVRITSSLGTQLLTIRSATFGSGTNTITTYESIAQSHTTTDGLVYFAPSEEEKTSNSLDAKDANGAHGMLECAGQGICDRSTGNCDCFPGYEGEACTRSVCPNDCSGNGICLSAKRLAADASKTYQFAWDSEKHFGCKCDVGFRGPDCSLQECPSDYDPMHGCGGGECNNASTDGSGNACPNTSSGTSLSDCSNHEQRDCSGRGLCDYETGTCKCFSGFFGQACENQTILI